MDVTSVLPLTADEELLWRSLTRVAIALPRALDDDLARHAGMSMTEYGVLMNLSEAPGGQLRMSELAAATSLSASRITRLVGDLQKLGLVARDRCAGDARGYVTTLTGAGLSRLKAAYPGHLASVRNRVMDHIDPAAVAALAQALHRIAADLP